MEMDTDRTALPEFATPADEAAFYRDLSIYGAAFAIDGRRIDPAAIYLEPDDPTPPA
jgi:hypothetical protein